MVTTARAASWGWSATPTLADGVFHLVIDHALLDGAKLGDLVSVLGLEAAHLAGADESQFPVVGVVENEVFDQLNLSTGSRPVGLGRPSPGEQVGHREVQERDELCCLLV